VLRIPPLLLLLVVVACAGRSVATPHAPDGPDPASPAPRHATPEVDLLAAEITLESAVREEPLRADLWKSWALVAYHRGDQARCIERIDRALDLEPADATALLTRGLARFESREFDGAMADFRSVIAMEPSAEAEAADAALRFLRVSEVLVRGPRLSRRFTAESGNYRVVTDGSEPQARVTAARLYVAHRAYQRLIPPPGNRAVPPQFQVTVFTRREDYVAYMTDVLGDADLARQSAGGYLPLTGEIVVTSGPTDGGAFAALYHEGFHQYFQSFVARPPVWLNEGLADYFAASRLVEGRLEPGIVHVGRERALRRMMARRPLGDPAQLLSMDHTAFMALTTGDRRRRGENYALAWATVHFLLEGGGSVWRNRFDRYLGAVVDGRSAGRAAEAAFGRDVERQLAERVDAHVRLLLADFSSREE